MVAADWHRLESATANEPPERVDIDLPQIDPDESIHSVHSTAESRANYSSNSSAYLELVSAAFFDWNQVKISIYKAIYGFNFSIF